MFGNLVSDALKADIARVVEIRNMFAHFPFQFEVIGEPPSQDVAAMFLGKAEKIELTSSLCIEYKSHILTTSDNLAEVSKRLKEIPSRVDQGEAVNLGGVIWMGHVGLDVDNWEVANPAQPLNANDIFLFSTKANMKIDINWAGADEESAVGPED